MTNKTSNRPVPTWCAGCGNFAVLSSLKKSIENLEIDPKNLVMCFDIGCGGNMSNLVEACVVETLHGRSIPVAVGIKTANPKLSVVAQAGDGGCLNEGLNHFIHSIRRDDRITLILNNNLVFGLTAGQKSSATPKAVSSQSASDVNEISPLSAVDLAATAGCRFIARVSETDIDLMQKILQEALMFEGFSLVEVIQPCKIWAKNFPKIDLEVVKKPFSNRTDVIGKNNLAGILYIDPQAAESLQISL